MPGSIGNGRDRIGQRVACREVLARLTLEEVVKPLTRVDTSTPFHLKQIAWAY